MPKPTRSRSRYFEKKIAPVADAPSPPSEPESPAEEYVPSNAEEDSESAVEEEEEEEEEEERPKKRARKGTKGAADNVRIPKLKPGEVFIPNRKRHKSDVEVEEGVLHPDTAAFVRDLGLNNEREWFHQNSADYKAAKTNFESFATKLSDKIIADVDTTIPELPMKDLVFRVARDIRFSNDKTPYKPYFSIAWSRTGRKGPYGHYYFHFEPGKSFLGAGKWHPEADALARIRSVIDRKPEKLLEVINGEKMKRFLNVSTETTPTKKKGAKEKSALDIFLEQNKEDALKTSPKGFQKDHPNIGLLRLRSFAVRRNLTDEEVMATDAVDTLAGYLSLVEPLVTRLNSIVMPDPDDDEDDDDEEESEEEDEEE